MPYQEHTLATQDDLPLFLRVWTPNESPHAILIIVHGLGEHAGRYDHLVSHFNEAGYSVYGHDHRGFGRSGGKRGDFETFDDLLVDLDQVVELARAMSPALPINLFAHSLGGMIGTHYLARFEDKISTAVLSSPGYGAGPDYNQAKLTMARVLNRLAPNMSMQTGSHDDEFTLSHCHNAEQRYRQDELYHHTVTIRFAATGLRKAEEAKLLLPSLQLPALLLLGEDDSTINREAILDAAAASGPNVTLRQYPGCLHEMHNEIEHLRDPVLNDTVNWMESALLSIR